MIKRTVSVSNELHLTMDAILGVRRLTRMWIDNCGLDIDDVPEAISALLVILVERLRLLDRVARGTVDPRLVWCPENDADRSPGDAADKNLRLVAWSDRKLARHHRVEWQRARTRLDAERQRTGEQRASKPAGT